MSVLHTGRGGDVEAAEVVRMLDQLLDARDSMRATNRAIRSLPDVGPALTGYAMGLGVGSALISEILERGTPGLVEVIASTRGAVVVE